jgi:hypothetical protein
MQRRADLPVVHGEAGAAGNSNLSNDHCRRRYLVRRHAFG